MSPMLVVGAYAASGSHPQSLSLVLFRSSLLTLFVSPHLPPPVRPRGAAASAVQRVAGGDPTGQPLSSSEEEPFGHVRPPRLPDSPHGAQLPSSSDSLRTSPEEASSASSSFVGLRVVAKWSSNGYFYSGRITKDMGEGRFGLRFDDGYECEVAGGDVLLCDPVPRGDRGHGAAGGGVLQRGWGGGGGGGIEN